MPSKLRREVEYRGPRYVRPTLPRNRNRLDRGEALRAALTLLFLAVGVALAWWSA